MLDARRLLLALTLVAAAAGTWWLARNLTASKATFDGHLRHDPDYIVENFTATVMNEDGRRQYTLTAPRLIHYGDDESSDIDQPYLVKYSEDGPPVRSRAQHGWMPKDNDVIVLTGDAQVTRARGPRTPPSTLRSDRIRVRLDK